MIEININPFALAVGSWVLSWGSIIAVLAAILALLLFVIEATRFGLKKVHIIGLCLLFPFAGYNGARVFSLVEGLLFYHTISLSARMPGAIMGIITILLIYASINKLSVWQLLDIGAMCLYPFIMLYRVGCVLNGCCYGIPCALPWAVVYTNPSTIAPLGMAIHPTQLYHLVWTAIVVATVWVLQKRFNTPGLLALLALILYSVGDFAIRLFRADEPTMLGLSLSQVTDLLLIVMAMSFLFLRLKVAGRRQELAT
ncbi:MAG: prolipoprotein diacylglyceryl transferase [Dehalococcoidia bacterium]|nr:prolipoprotein diacylglyceryl transferase [Dehalococcoidia bacterium]